MAELAGALQIDPEKRTVCKQCELACSWIQTGTFQPSKPVIRVHVFEEQASGREERVLQDGETVRIFPPVSGG